MKSKRTDATVGIAKETLAELFANMPPLSHNPTGEFSWDKSEVVQWLFAQPGLRQRVFDLARYAGVIRYDRETGRWVGCNNAAQEPHHG